jgi:hypothetical protein
MARFKNPLDDVEVAAPCKADWDQMIGSERMRFCGQCNLNVFNLSAMSRVEAESLIARTEGRLCVKFYRRFDGSIITRDCPLGLRAIQRRVSYLAKAILAAAFSFLASVGVQALIPDFSPPLSQLQGVMAVPDSVIRPPVPSPAHTLMGKVMIRPLPRHSRKAK